MNLIKVFTKILDTDSAGTFSKKGAKETQKEKITKQRKNECIIHKLF